MAVKDQLDRIRAQLVIEDNGVDEAREVFMAACNAFRKWLSPVRSPAGAWIDNVQTMLIKCRLDGDATSIARLLAVRAAALIDSTVKPGMFDELSLAAGLDLLPGSSSGIGTGERITIGDDERPAGSARLVVKGVAVVIRDAPMEAEFETDDMLEAVAFVDRLQTRNTGGSKYVEVKYGPASDYEGEIFDTVHDPWRPTTVFSPLLKAHPTQIIEPSTLAATPYPPATYIPLLPAEAIQRGFVSDVQFEAVVYALQAVTQYLPGSPFGARGRKVKGGFILGDGTGAGKSNIICAIIMDQWMRGKKRHIIVVERGKHVKHLQESWSMIGGNPKDIMFQGDYSASETIPNRDGVMITTYALIRDDRRYGSLLEWGNMHGELSGILAFDEAHNMRNAVEDIHDEGSGRRAQSQQGIRGVELQMDLPECGVVYASATMATDVYNLGYAPRLGIWGENAPFASESGFISEMHVLDDNALEQICIDLKSAGRYCSRTLSFDGVEYDEVVHRLTPAQRRTFDGMVKGWKELNNIYLQAVRISLGKKDAFANGRLSSYRRSSIEQLLASFNTEAAIEDIHRELAKGHAPVVQIAYTGEARLRRIADGRDYVPDADFKETEIVKWIESKMPDGACYKDSAGNLVPVLDASGNPKSNPEVVTLKEKAKDLATKLSVRHSVLDRLYEAFGDDMIAEMTGRSIRALPVIKGGATVGWDIRERSDSEAVADVERFQSGKKQILVFSLSAGGTGLSYHAAPDVRNQRRRIHYIIELGYRAESAVQGMGRTHRAGQVIAPFVKLVTSDVPAHAIYAARTLSKIAKMGALSRGHQHATTNAIFEQRVPISGVYAQKGWSATLRDIEEGRLGDITLETLAADLELKTNGDMSIRSLEVVIMKLATLTDGDQRLLIDTLTQRTEEAIATAVRQGDYNQGLETIRADSIEVVDVSQIENVNGSKTTYYRLRKREEIERLPFRRAAMTAAAARSKRSGRAVFMRHKVNGRIQLGVLREGPTRIVDIFSPSGTSTRMQEALQREPWKIIESMEESERLWNLESETLDMREETDLHILSGSLLFNWNKLPKSGVGLNRCRTDDGKIIVGRVINSRDLRKTLHAMGMRSNYRPMQIAAMLGKVDQGATIQIDNGWKIEAPFSAMQDYRLIVPDEEQTGMQRAEITNMGIVAHDTPLGYEMEIPRADAVDIIQRLVIGCEMTLTGTTVNQGSMQVAQAPIQTIPLAALK